MKWQLSSIFYVFPLHKQLIFSFFNRQCFCQGDKMTQFATRHCKEPYTKECNLMHHGHLIKQKSQALKLTTHHWKSDLKQLFNYSFKVYHTLHFRYSSVSAYTKKKKKLDQGKEQGNQLSYPLNCQKYKRNKNSLKNRDTLEKLFYFLTTNWIRLKIERTIASP